jgi:hypothetical protein
MYSDCLFLLDSVSVVHVILGTFPLHLSCLGLVIVCLCNPTYFYNVGSVRNKTPKDHQSHNPSHRSGDSSWQGNIYFCRRLCWQRKHWERAIGPGPCPFILIGQVRTQSAPDWLMLHLEFGGKVGSSFPAKMEVST